MLRRLQGQSRTVANHLFLPITSGKSASVYECFPFIWPYNGRSALLPECLPRVWAQGSLADFSSRWFPRTACHGNGRVGRNLSQKDFGVTFGVGFRWETRLISR